MKDLDLALGTGQGGDHGRAGILVQVGQGGLWEKQCGWAFGDEGRWVGLPALSRLAAQLGLAGEVLCVLLGTHRRPPLPLPRHLEWRDAPRSLQSRPTAAPVL